MPQVRGCCARHGSDLSFLCVASAPYFLPEIGCPGARRRSSVLFPSLPWSAARTARNVTQCPRAGATPPAIPLRPFPPPGPSPVPAPAALLWHDVVYLSKGYAAPFTRDSHPPPHEVSGRGRVALGGGRRRRSWRWGGRACAAWSKDGGVTSWTASGSSQVWSRCWARGSPSSPGVRAGVPETD